MSYAMQITIRRLSEGWVNILRFFWHSIKTFHLNLSKVPFGWHLRSEFKAKEIKDYTFVRNSAYRNFFPGVHYLLGWGGQLEKSPCILCRISICALLAGWDAYSAPTTRSCPPSPKSQLRQSSARSISLITRTFLKKINMYMKH